MSKLASRLIIFLILLGIVAAVAFVMNPSEEDHKTKLYTAIQKNVAGDGIVEKLGAKLAEKVGILDKTGIVYEYQNYMVFSTMKRGGEAVTLGLFGKIFVLDDSI